MDNEWLPFALQNSSSSTSTAKELPFGSEDRSSTPPANTRSERQRSFENFNQNGDRRSSNTPILRPAQRGWLFEVNRRPNQNKSSVGVPIFLPGVDKKCITNVGTKRFISQNRSQGCLLPHTNIETTSEVLSNQNSSRNLGLRLSPIWSGSGTIGIHESIASGPQQTTETNEVLHFHRRHPSGRKKSRHPLNDCPPSTTWISSESEEVDSPTKPSTGLLGLSTEYKNKNDCTSMSKETKFIEEDKPIRTTQENKVKRTSLDCWLLSSCQDSSTSNNGSNNRSSTNISQPSEKHKDVDQEPIQNFSISSSDENNQVSEFRKPVRRPNNNVTSTSDDKNNNGCFSTGLWSSDRVQDQSANPISRVVESKGISSTYQPKRISSGNQGSNFGIEEVKSATFLANIRAQHRLNRSKILDEQSGSDSGFEEGTSSYEVRSLQTQHSRRSVENKIRGRRLHTANGRAEQSDSEVESSPERNRPIRQRTQRSLSPIRIKELSPKRNRNRCLQNELDQAQSVCQSPILTISSDSEEDSPRQTTVITPRSTSLENKTLVQPTSKTSKQEMDEKSRLSESPRGSVGLSDMENDIFSFRKYLDDKGLGLVLNRWAKTTQTNYVRYFDNFMNQESFTEREFDDIEPVDIVNFATKYNGNTRKIVINALAQMLDLVRTTKISTSPLLIQFAKAITNSRPPPNTKPPLTSQEIGMINKLMFHLRDLNIFALNWLDLRTNVMAQLVIEGAMRICDIPTTLRQVDITDTDVTIYQWRTKNIKLSKSSNSVMAKRIARRPKADIGELLSRYRDHPKTLARKSMFLFFNATDKDKDRTLETSTVKQRLKDLLQSLDIQVSPSTLRSYSVSIAMSRGASTEDAMKMGQWKNKNILMQHYLRVPDRAFTQYADALRPNGF